MRDVHVRVVSPGSGRVHRAAVGLLGGDDRGGVGVLLSTKSPFRPGSCGSGYSRPRTAGSCRYHLAGSGRSDHDVRCVLPAPLQATGHPGVPGRPRADRVRADLVPRPAAGGPSACCQRRCRLAHAHLGELGHPGRSPGRAGRVTPGEQPAAAAPARRPPGRSSGPAAPRSTPGTVGDLVDRQRRCPAPGQRRRQRPRRPPGPVPPAHMPDGILVDQRPPGVVLTRLAGRRPAP